MCILLNVTVVSSPGVQIGSPVPVEMAAHGATTSGAKAPPTTTATTMHEQNMQPQFYGQTAMTTTAAKPPSTALGASFVQAGGVGGGAGGSSALASSLYPIASLNPYQNKWTIKARITNKAEIKNYNSAKGAGKLCSIDLLDNQGGEIRATMFNEQVDAFYPILEKGAVYIISGGSIKQANKKFSHLKHEYEITFNSTTRIERVAVDTGDIKQMVYEFVSIADIASKAKEDIVDVLAVVVQVGDLTSFLTKRGDSLAKVFFLSSTRFVLLFA